jgi:tRNA (adenine37-N6)-methyltransferase
VPEQFVLTAIGHIQSGRSHLEDDGWGETQSVFVLDTHILPENCLDGLEEFSHIEVVFLFHKVDPDKVHIGKRRPRGLDHLPLVGTLAQRAKARFNRLGVSRCRLLAREGNCLILGELDAIDGTPVVDIKPYLPEFGARGEVHTPDWAREVMQQYYAIE